MATLNNTVSNALFNGTNENDIITNSGSNVSINGGTGNDTIDNLYNVDVVINAGSGNDIINLADETGFKSHRALIQHKSGDGNDTIYGYSPTDIICLAEKNFSTLTSGDDILIAKSTGETLRLKDAKGTTLNIVSGISFDLSKTFTPTDNQKVILQNDSQFVNVNAASSSYALAIDGNDANNSLVGTAQDDSIDGGAGDDVLVGGGGNDTLQGGDGNDVFVYSGGKVVVTDYDEEHDRIILTTGTVLETLAEGADLKLITKDGTLTLLNGDGKKISLIDFNGDTLDDYEFRAEIHRTALAGLELLLRAYEEKTLSDATSSPKVDEDVVASNVVFEGQLTASPAANKDDSNPIEIAKSIMDSTREIVKWSKYKPTTQAEAIQKYSSMSAAALNMYGAITKKKYSGFGSSIIVFAGAVLVTTDGMTHAERDALVTSTIDVFAEGSKLLAKAIPSKIVSIGLVMPFGGIDLAAALLKAGYMAGFGEDGESFLREFDKMYSYGFFGMLRDLAAKLSAKPAYAPDASISPSDPNKGQSVVNSIPGKLIVTGGGNDYISNGDGNRVINGVWTYSPMKNAIFSGAGNDHIINKGDGVFIDAGAGNDTIESAHTVTDWYDYTMTNNVIYGGDGNDVIHVGNEFTEVRNFYLNGGDGNDFIRSRALYSLINGENGNDALTNFGIESTISGGNDDDTLENSGANSQLFGDNGNDKIYNYHYSKDSTIDGGAGNDRIINSASDVIIYDDSGDNTIANNYAETNIGYYAGNNAIISAGDGNDSISNGDASHYGGNSVIINAGGGNNTISNSGKEVTINSGEGNDSIISTGDNNTINAGDGDNTISSSGKEVLINSGEGNDSIVSSGDSVTIDAGAGNDTISGAGKYLKISAGAGDDSVYGGDSRHSNNTIDADSGDDTIRNGSAETSISGGAGNDSILSFGYKVTIDGGNGNDTISNEGANAKISADSGDDYITNNRGAENIEINAGAGNDFISNKGGSNGEGKNTTITAGSGNDTISNESASVTVNTGDGNNYVSNSGSQVVIYASAGNDFISNKGTQSTITAGSGNDTISNESANVMLNGNAGDDSICIRSSTVSVEAGDGNDFIQNGLYKSSSEIYVGSYVTLNGGAGNDNIQNWGGSKISINGGLDDDIIQNGFYELRYHKVYAGSSVTIDAGEGNDFISNYGSNVTIDSGDGKNTIQNGFYDADYPKSRSGDSVNITGGKDDDFINNLYGSKVTINGGAGNDTIKNDFYDSSRNRLLAGKNITIESGAGNDFISNRGDNVRFVYNVGDGKDLIQGFNATSTLQISNGNVIVTEEIVNSDVIFTIGEGKITLVGAAGLKPVNVETSNSLLIKLTENADNYSNTLGNATILAGAGNDTISNSGASVSINAGEGNDSINNNAVNNVTISTAAGDDTIKLGTSVKAFTVENFNSGDVIEFTSSATLEQINNAIKAGDVTIGGLNLASIGNDWNGLSYQNITIAGAKVSGKKIIYDSLEGSKNLFTIDGLKDTTGVEVAGENVILTDAALANRTKEKITLVDETGDLDYKFALASDSTVKTNKDSAKINPTLTVDGENHVYSSTSYGEWYAVDNNTITYNASIAAEEFTISGLSPTASLSENVLVNDNVFTFKDAALNKKDVSISGDNVAISLASDVDTDAETIDEVKNFKDGILSYTAAGVGEFYKIDGTQVIYTSATARDTFTLSGIKSADGVTIDGNKVTINEANLAEGATKVELITTGNYTLELTGVTTEPKRITTNAFGIVASGKVDYISTTKTSDYWQRIGNKYTLITTGDAEEILFTLSGIRTTDGITVDANKKTVTLKAANLGTTDVTFSANSGGYTFVLEGVEEVKTTVAGFTGNTYKTASNTAGYSISNGIIKYTAAVEATNLFTLSGVKTTNGIIVDENKKTVTLKAANLGTTDVSFSTNSGGCTLTLDGVKAPETTAAGFTGNTYKTASNTAGYSISNGTIKYTAAKAATNLFTLNGVKTTNGIIVDENKKTVTLKAANLGTTDVSFSTNSGGCTLTLDGVKAPETTAAGFTGNTYKTASNTAGYSLSNGVIKYTAAKAATNLFTLNGVKTTNGIIVDENKKTVTLKAANLGTTDVSFSTNSGGCTLTLDGVKAPETTAAGFTGNTYKTASNTVGYSISNGVIKYTAAKAATNLFTLNGVKTTEGIIVDENKKTVTLKAANLNKKNVTITGGYTLKLTSDVDTTKEIITGWTTLKSGNVAYLEGGTGEYYSVKGGKLTYNASVAGANKVEFSGVKGTPTLSSGKVSLKADNFASNVSVASNAGGYSLVLSGNFGGKTFTGTANADKITNSGSNISINGGAGNDSISNSGKNVTIVGGKGNDVVTLGSNSTFYYAKNNGNDVLYKFADTDKIKLSGTTKATPTISGKDVVITTDGGKITVKDAATNKKITVVDSKNKVLSAYTYSANGIADGKSITLNASFSGKFNAKNYINVNGSNVTSSVSITGGSSASTLNGSAKADSIIGGKGNDKLFGNAGNDTLNGGDGTDTLSGGAGNDTLVGGAGNDSLSGGDGTDTLNGGAGNDKLLGGKGRDVFVFSGGKDTIADYAANDDKISVASGLGKGSFAVSGKNVVFTYGSNSLTVIKGLDKKITLINGVSGTYTKSGIFNEDSTSVTLPAATKTFKATSYSKLVTVDASAASSTIKITGNGKANYLVSGNNGSTLTGGTGNDTLLGGNGKDSLSGGNNNDSLYGGAGADILLGGNGNDTLWGGTGNDSLYGGAGNDKFIYKVGEGKDTIFDYSSGDMLQILKSNGKEGGTFSKSSFSGGKLTLTISGGGTVIFDDVTKKDNFNINGKTYAISGSKLE